MAEPLNHVQRIAFDVVWIIRHLKTPTLLAPRCKRGFYYEWVGATWGREGKKVADD
jgi:hypothetical protein